MSDGAPDEGTVDDDGADPAPPTRTAAAISELATAGTAPFTLPCTDATESSTISNAASPIISQYCRIWRAKRSSLAWPLAKSSRTSGMSERAVSSVGATASEPVPVARIACNTVQISPTEGAR